MELRDRKRGEYNGLIGEGEGKRGKDNGAESGTKERDVALFRRTKEHGQTSFQSTRSG